MPLVCRCRGPCGGGGVPETRRSLQSPQRIDRVRWRSPGGIAQFAQQDDHLRPITGLKFRYVELYPTARSRRHDFTDCTYHDVIITRAAPLMRIGRYFISFAFARTSSTSPTYRNACSGRSSALPEMISSKLRSVSAIFTYLPSLPVNCCAT
jgi:hypothetical protein